MGLAGAYRVTIETRMWAAKPGRSAAAGSIGGLWTRKSMQEVTLRSARSHSRNARKRLRPKLVLASGLVAFATMISPAPAHYWYPKKCCNDQDCFRATAIKRLSDGRLKIDAGHITVIVPPNFPALPSLDNDPHVCVYRDNMGRYRPRCVFLPGVS